jgi:hypothetical protein
MLAAPPVPAGELDAERAAAAAELRVESAGRPRPLIRRYGSPPCFLAGISGWRGGALYPLRLAAKRRGESGAVLFYFIGAVLSLFWSASGAGQARGSASPRPACNDMVMGFLNKLSSSLADQSGGSE